MMLGLILFVLGSLLVVSFLSPFVYARVYSDAFFVVTLYGALVGVVAHPVIPQHAASLAGICIGGLFAHLILHVL